MASFTLGAHFDAFVKELLAAGRFNNASEVIRAGLRLLEDEERARGDRFRSVADTTDAQQLAVDIKDLRKKARKRLAAQATL